MKMANEFSDVKKKVFSIASLIDSQLRVASMGLEFDEVETDYLENWLKSKEVDPILGSVIAQLLGLREIPEQEDDDAN